MKKNITCLFNTSAKCIFGLGLLWAAAGATHKLYAQTYCTPAYTYDCSTSDDVISDVTLDGANGTSISNTGTACSPNNYGDYTSLAAPDLIVGSTYMGSVGTTYFFPSDEYVRAWIDYDNNGTFDNSEEIAAIDGIASSGSSPISFTVPSTATPGLRRMRVRLVWDEYPASGIDPCSNYDYGETEDYMVNVQPLAPPDNAGVDSLVSPAMNGVFCSGDQPVKVRVRNLGINAIHSVKVNWSVNGVLQTPVDYNSVIDSIYSSATNFAIVTLGIVHFPYNTPVTLKSWTSMPNGVADNDNSDDTLTAVVTSSTQGVIVNITPQDTSFCAGSQLLLDAGQQPAGAIYIWSTGALSQMISVSQGGVYSVKVQSLGGCTDVDTVTITELPQPQAGSLAIMDNGSNSYSFTITGAQHIDNYSWDFGDGTTAGGPGPQTHTYAQPGVYTVVVWLSNACDTIVLTGDVQVFPPTGIPGVAKLQQAIRLYPNPADNKVRISSDGSCHLTGVDVYDIMGRKVSIVKASGTEVILHTDPLASGLYQVSVHTDKGTITKKLEIRK